MSQIHSVVAPVRSASCAALRHQRQQQRFDVARAEHRLAVEGLQFAVDPNRRAARRTRDTGSTRPCAAAGAAARSRPDNGLAASGGGASDESGCASTARPPAQRSVAEGGGAVRDWNDRRRRPHRCGARPER